MEQIQLILKIVNEAKEIWFHIIAISSLVVLLFPVLKKSSALLPIIKFIGKFGALNRSVTDEMRSQ